MIYSGNEVREELESKAMGKKEVIEVSIGGWRSKVYEIGRPTQRFSIDTIAVPLFIIIVIIIWHCCESLKDQEVKYIAKIKILLRVDLTAWNKILFSWLDR